MTEKTSENSKPQNNTINYKYNYNYWITLTDNSNIQLL